MKSVCWLVAIVCSVLCVGSLITLISSVAGACHALVNLTCVVVFMVSSVAAADGWYKGVMGLKGKK